tara:strand:- start:2941 stop:3990 length:1050 start_codon:yes stop_codon:yes gene_type:complete
LARKKVLLTLPVQALDNRATQNSLPEMEALRPLADIVEFSGSDPDEFLELARDADAIIIAWGVKVTREVCEQLERCQVISCASVGVDSVDVAAATDHGIVVTNVPDIFIEEVADHTIMLWLATLRLLNEMQDFARGEWRKARPRLSTIPRIWGQTFGLLSFGNVARAVARRAKPFGVQLISCDPFVSELKMTGEGVEPVSLDELLERSDYLSMHPPHNAETDKLMSTDAFRRMKNSSLLINCGRGKTVDETALIAALEQGEIAGAGLDVLEQEPPDPDNPLLTMPNVIVTPHVASATSRMRPATRRRAGHEVAQVLRGMWPMSCVNPAVLPKVELERWQPYPMERGPNR